MATFVICWYNLCKQFGSRSGPTKCRAWSGSKLFDTLIIFLKDFFEKIYLKKAKNKNNKKHRHWKGMQNYPACKELKLKSAAYSKSLKILYREIFSSVLKFQLIEVLLMSTHNIGFHREIRKIITCSPFYLGLCRPRSDCIIGHVYLVLCTF